MTEIRVCTQEDAIAVSALLGELGYAVSAQQASEHIRQLGETGSDPIVVAVAEGRIIGLLASHLCQMLQYDKPVMRVTALVVNRLARRRGIAKLLMEVGSLSSPRPWGAQRRTLFIAISVTKRIRCAFANC